MVILPRGTEGIYNGIALRRAKRLRRALVAIVRNVKKNDGRLDTPSHSMAIFNSGRRTLGDVRPLDAEPGIEPRLGPF